MFLIPVAMAYTVEVLRPRVVRSVLSRWADEFPVHSVDYCSAVEMASWGATTTADQLTLGLCDTGVVLALAQLREASFCGHTVFILRGVGACPQDQGWGAVMLKDLLMAPNCVVSWEELRLNERWYVQAIYDRM